MGGATAEVMGGILQLEADRRAINITVHPYPYPIHLTLTLTLTPNPNPNLNPNPTPNQVNSLDTDLDLKQREKLYPTIGLLFPEGTSRLAKQLAPKREQPTYCCRHISAALPRRCIRRWVDAGLCHALERRDRAAPMPVWGRGATCYHVPAQHSLLSLSHG